MNAVAGNEPTVNRNSVPVFAQVFAIDSPCHFADRKSRMTGIGMIGLSKIGNLAVYAADSFVMITCGNKTIRVPAPFGFHVRTGKPIMS